MPGGACKGGIPGLGPCIIAGFGRVITGATGDPSWEALPPSEEGPWSPVESSVDSSGGFTLPAAANFTGSNSVGMKGTPPGGRDVGDSMMGAGKAGGLPSGSVSWTGGI